MKTLSIIGLIVLVVILGFVYYKNVYKQSIPVDRNLEETKTNIETTKVNTFRGENITINEINTFQDNVMLSETLPERTITNKTTSTPQYTSKSLYEDTIKKLSKHSQASLELNVKNSSFGQSIGAKPKEGKNFLKLTTQAAVSQNAVVIFQSCVDFLNKTNEFRPSGSTSWNPSATNLAISFEESLPAGEQCFVVYTREQTKNNNDFKDGAVWGAVWSNDSWPVIKSNNTADKGTKKIVTSANDQTDYTVVGSSVDVVSQHSAKLGAMKMAVIFAKEKDVNPSFDKNKIISLIKTDVNNLLKTISYKQLSFKTVDSFGWFEYPVDEWCQITSAKLDVVTTEQFKQKVNIADYHTVAVITDVKNANKVDECNWGGNGKASPYPVGITTKNGKQYGRYLLTLYGNKNYYLKKQRFFPRQEYKLPDSEAYSNPNGRGLVEFVGVFVHEFLHTQGIAGHAATKYCSGSILAGPNGEWWKCTTRFYNMFDLMSSSRFFGLSLSVPFREKLGWLTGGRKVNIKKSGTYRLNSLNSSNGVVAFYIKPTGEQSKPLWFEYRISGDFDYALSYEPFKKVINGLLIYQGSLLLDATPPGVNVQGEDLIPIFGSELDVALQNSIEIKEYGVNIDVIRVNPPQGWIEFKVEFTE